MYLTLFIKMTIIYGHNKQREDLSYLLKQNKVSSTFLFTGISGIGKSLIAIEFIKKLFCESETKPCNNCKNCHLIDSKTHPDFILIEPDEKGKIAIGSPKEVGTVRWLIDKLTKKSISGKYAVLIKDLDILTIQSQNALLKTIEEPPDGAVIILTASNKSQILQTIISRSFHIPFQPLKNSEMKKILENEKEDKSNDLLIEISGGSVETASLLSDSTIFTQFLTLTEEISDCLNGKKDPINININELKKTIAIPKITTILVEIYRSFLLNNIKKTEIHRVFSGIALTDEEKLKTIIKIFLVQKKGFSNNLNTRNLLKSMIYNYKKAITDTNFKIIR